MITNGYDVAVLEHHVASSYSGFTNVYSQARISYYGISSIPSSYFDGVLNVVGGSSGTYSAFVSKYNQRINIQSYFTIQLNGVHTGLNYNVLATITKVGNYTGANPVFQFVITESNLSYSGDVYNHVTRLMSPNASGTAMNFSSGNVQTVNLNFNVGASWNLANCEIVAFLQNNSTKEVLQTVKLPINNLQGMAADAGLIGVSNLPVGACSGVVTPTIQLKNFSSINVNAAVIKYSINGGILANYNWTGNLTQNQVQNISLPQMNFTVEPVNNFTAYLYSTNGMADLDPVNDTTESSFNEASTYGFNLNIELMTDNNPNQTTWQVKNAAGSTIAQGGPYTQPNTVIQHVVNVNETGCYRFIINDSGGDGICCSSGNGYYRLSDYYDEVIQLGGSFGSTETTEFYLTGIQVNAMVFLEGPFNDMTYDMNTGLNQGGLIPLTQPFNTSPWNYDGNETVTTLPNPSIVDWVLIECRETSGDASTATEQTIVGRRAAFLHRFGYIVDLDGVSPVRFNLNINENLYLVIRHRNHLGIMSSQAATPSGGIYYCDFTSDEFQTYGGSMGCVDIMNLGLWGMAAGDMNGDGQINDDDKNNIWTPQAGAGGYMQGDINLDGQTDNIDKNDILPGNLGMSSQVPSGSK